MAYEQAEQIVARQRIIGVRDCHCRHAMALLGHACGYPMEVCLVFGDFVDSAERAGQARRIRRDEAIDLLHRAETAGLVLQPTNAQNPAGMCMCCGCCCGILRVLKMYDRPADVAVSPFLVQLDVDACAGCGTCEGRCQMEAITLGADGVAVLREERCIGCGLCVSTCPSEALSLVRKPAGRQPSIARTTTTAYLGWAWERDRLTPSKLAEIGLKSAVDRLLAPRR